MFLRSLDSKTRKRFSQWQEVRARESTSFWRENVTATKGFSENVMEAEISHQMLEVLSFCDWERAQTPSIKITVLTFLVKKVQQDFPGLLLPEKRQKTAESSMFTNLKVSNNS